MSIRKSILAVLASTLIVGQAFAAGELLNVSYDPTSCTGSAN